MDQEIELLDVNGHLVRVLVTTALLAVGETLSSESSLRVPCGSFVGSLQGLTLAEAMANVQLDARLYRWPHAFTSLLQARVIRHYTAKAPRVSI